MLHTCFIVFECGADRRSILAQVITEPIWGDLFHQGREITRSGSNGNARRSSPAQSGAGLRTGQRHRRRRRRGHHQQRGRQRRIPWDSTTSASPIRSNPGTSPSGPRPWWSHHKSPGNIPIWAADESVRRISGTTSTDDGISADGVSTNDGISANGNGPRGHHPPQHDPAVHPMEPGPGQSTRPNQRRPGTRPSTITGSTTSGPATAGHRIFNG